MVNALGTYAASYGYFTPAGLPAPAGFSGAVKPSETAGGSDSKAIERASSPSGCQTCKDRKYQDGSDEMVSFKAATHISPASSGALVRSHEQEHVSNAYKDASLKNGKVLSATVSIHTSVCPECGRSYVSGGTTRTKISYPNESNPYTRQTKQLDGINLRGSFINAAL